MTNHFADYWGNNSTATTENETDTGSEQRADRVFDPVAAERAIDDYWGSSSRAPLPIEQLDEIPWTVETAETVAETNVSGVDVTGAPEHPDVDTSQLDPPGHLSGAPEIGYGMRGAPAPFVPSRTLELEQKIVIAVAERIVAEGRAILVQNKVAENCHFETWPFANNTIVAPTQVGYTHPNGIGYRIVASAAGLYVGESQAVGTGNFGIPVPTGTLFLEIPANCDLWISSAGQELTGGVVDLYVIQFIMGTTTLSGGGGDIGGGR